MKLTHKRLKQVLQYKPLSGHWRWRVAVGPRVKVGMRAGTLHKHGYIHIKLGGRIYKAHRLAWFYMTERWPRSDVEHKNRKKADNRWCNFRLADDSKNQANANKRRDNTSGFKSVYRRENGKWRASIQVRKRRFSLGTFDTPALAHAAYVKAAQVHFGEFACAG